MPRKCVNDCYVLISVVDSTPRVSELPSLPPLLKTLGARHWPLGSGMVVSGDTLLALVEDHAFFDGFDELWLFVERPSEKKPEAIPLTSDVRLLQDPPVALVNWMHENGCLAGLGDGDGLNFVTVESKLAQLWAKK